MTKINLNRISSNEPDFEEFKRMLEEMKAFLTEDPKPDNQDWVDNLEAILEFQDEDGSFRLVDSYKIPMDARADFCHIPTYICTAILMKAYMTEKVIFDNTAEQILRKALYRCSEIRIRGNGMEFFEQADISGFLKHHHDLCHRFSRIMDKHYRNVFVYGTLMRGEANHDYYLSNSWCKGRATVSGFKMYDIGAFPGIVPGEGTVPGELYKVDYETLQRLDYLEGEGSLYIRRNVPVTMSTGERAFAWIYVYNGSIDGLEKLPVWKRHDYVWYVSYGSNMLKKRFMCYIKGGSFEAGGAEYEACDNLTEPLDIRACEIPYDMYYGNRSGSWGGKGVSFLDITKTGAAKGVAYLITREQFDHVACQENGGCRPEYSNGWYNTVVSLGTMDGCDIVTITNDELREYNEPAEAYVDTLNRGLRENNADMSDEMIGEYLMSCNRAGH